MGAPLFKTNGWAQSSPYPVSPFAMCVCKQNKTSLGMLALQCEINDASKDEFSEFIFPLNAMVKIQLPLHSMGK